MRIGLLGVLGIAVLVCEPRLGAAVSDTRGPDPVVARILEHGGAASRPIVVVVGPEHLPKSVWQTAGDLVAYRLHRPSGDGATITDAAIYLLRTSDLYYRASKVLRTRATGQDEVWCFLAAVLSHEAAHTGVDTERQALEAEAAQLRQCAVASHLAAGDVAKIASRLAKIEAKLRKYDPR